jgi:hypothetical protein
MLVIRIACITVGALLIAMSTFLHETEEGAIQNKLDEWRVVLSETEPRAINRHAAFVAAVAGLGGRLFDALFGQRLVSPRSVGVSACFSLASLFLVCSPGLSGMLSEIPGSLYYSLLVGLIAMGALPSLLKSRRPIRPRLLKTLWLVGIVILVFCSYFCMDIVNWFNVPYRVTESGLNLKIHIPYRLEAFYYVAFIFITIASDSLFIVSTRWLLRKSSGLLSTLQIIGVMLGNVILACSLVILPVALAWGASAVTRILAGGKIVKTTNDYVLSSDSHQSFLASLGASNILDGLVACVFFVLLFTFLAHRLVWPIVKRPVYAVARCGIVRRRRLFLVLGIAMVGFGGMPTATIHFAKKIADTLLD